MHYVKKFITLGVVLLSIIGLETWAASSEYLSPFERDRQNLHHKRVLKEDTPINVLSIDGGGVRGMIPALILKELEERSEKRISELFDMVVGTSTGGILSLGLTTPHPNWPQQSRYTALEMVRFYNELASEIFPQPAWWEAPFRPVLSLLEESKYAAEPLERKLEEYLGETSLKDLVIPTVITSVDAQSNTFKPFRSYRAQWDKDENFYLYDVGRATSAAPSYFPTAHIRPIGASSLDTFSLVDGGMAANNPAQVALVEAYSLFGNRPVNLVSLGTGENAGVLGEVKETIYALRAKPTIDMLFDAQAHTVHSSLYALAQADPTLSYTRFQCGLSSNLLAMDKPGNLSALRAKAQELIEDNSAEIDTLIEHLWAAQDVAPTRRQRISLLVSNPKKDRKD